LISVGPGTASRIVVPAWRPSGEKKVRCEMVTDPPPPPTVASQLSPAPLSMDWSHAHVFGNVPCCPMSW
jgi:hypothetical protein